MDREVDKISNYFDQIEETTAKINTNSIMCWLLYIGILMGERKKEE